MRATALAFKQEFDEVPVSSIEVLEVNVVAIRDDLNELKSDFRELKDEVRQLRSEFHAAVARLDNDIKTAVIRLQEEIRAVAQKAERDLKEFADRIETQLREMRAEDKELRERIDVLDRKVDHIGTKLNLLLGLVGALGTAAIVFVTVGKALHWF